LSLSGQRLGKKAAPISPPSLARRLGACRLEILMSLLGIGLAEGAQIF
jgi:hypothetical protein